MLAEAMDRFPEAQLEASHYEEVLRRVAVRVFGLARDLEDELKSTRKGSFEEENSGKPHFLKQLLENVEQLSSEIKLLISGGLHPQHDSDGHIMFGQAKFQLADQPASAFEKGVRNVYRAVSVKRSISTKPPGRLENVEGVPGAESPSPFQDKRRSKKIRGFGEDQGGAAFDEQRKKIQRRENMAMSKRTLRFPGKDPEQLMDEWAWRKYGQKRILGKRHPRCYYRCSRSVELGCQAKKHTQKCEGDNDVLEITYIGEHTCEFTSAKASSRPPAAVEPARLQFLDPKDASLSDSSLDFVCNSGDRNFSVVENTDSSFSQFALPPNEFLSAVAVGSTSSSSSASTSTENGQLVLQSEFMNAQSETEQQLGLPKVESIQITTSSSPSCLHSQISPQPFLPLRFLASDELFEENWRIASLLSEATGEPANNCVDSRDEGYQGLDSVPSFGTQTGNYPILEETQRSTEMLVHVLLSQANSLIGLQEPELGKSRAGQSVQTEAESETTSWMMDSIYSATKIRCPSEISTDDQTHLEFLLDVEN